MTLNRWTVAAVMSLLPLSAAAETLDNLLTKGPVVAVERDEKKRFKSATGIIAIDAPIERVWSTLIDFQKYSEFIPKVVNSAMEELSPTERRVSWEIEVPGPNTKYQVLYHLKPEMYVIDAEQVGGDLKGSRWHWWLESAGPSRTLVHYTSQAKHFSSILENLEDDQQTITIGVNVGGVLALLNALKGRIQGQ